LGAAALAAWQEGAAMVPGNSSYPAEVLLRWLLAGIWHNLSDPALEAAIADRLSFRRFVV